VFERGLGAKGGERGAGRGKNGERGRRGERGSLNGPTRALHRMGCRERHTG